MLDEAKAKQKAKLFEYREQGLAMKDAAAKVGVSMNTGYRWEYAQREHIGRPLKMTVKAQQEAQVPGPKIFERLRPEAQRAFNDFAYFERRYFGMIPHPWQSDAAEQIKEYLASPDKEYLVVNAPPGAGKTSLFTLRIPAWLTCRDRTLRGMIGSATKSLAKNNVMLLRREFSRVHPIQNPIDQVDKGLAFDAEATMAKDFGRFKPLERDLWTADAFTVEQFRSKGPMSEKEPTWSAYGIDAEYTGLRYPFILWDDLVSLANQSTPEMREKIERIWMSVCENRLEPGGVLILMGQRLLPDDLYAFAKSMTIPLDPDAEEEAESLDPGYVTPTQPKYTTLIYKAHYEDRCQREFHKRGAPAWPDGCLLVPERLTWRDILVAEAKPDYRTVYQQEDVNPEDVLVRREWIFGDDNHTGCLDRDRDMWEVPNRTDGQFLSILTADPSPTNFWAVELWFYHPESEQRFLIALWRKRMGAPDFLDEKDGEFQGLLQEWWEMSEAMGYPFSHMIFEVNAAQKFFLQSDMFRRWRDRRGVEVIPHTTGRNKADEDYGIWSLQPLYRFGRVRLPFREGSVGRARTSDLVKELTTYTRTGSGKTDDCVIAHWFLEWNLQNIYLPARHKRHQSRPTWLKPKARQAGGRKVGLGHALRLPVGG